MTSMRPSSPTVQRPQNHGYRGRVRTGCLTCRSRKVKCDETRPICLNCSRKNRECIFQPRKSAQVPVTASSSVNASTPETNHDFPLRAYCETTAEEQTYPTPPCDSSSKLVHATWGTAHGAFTSSRHLEVDAARRWNFCAQTRNEMSIAAEEFELHAASPSTFISRDINLTTTMDKLTAHESSEHSWIQYFVDKVESSWITPYDELNWHRAKIFMVEMSRCNASITSAIAAVSALYTAQLHSLPLSKAMSLYTMAMSAYDSLVKERTTEFEVVLVVAFLLTLFGFIDYETLPVLREPNDHFTQKFESRSRQQSWSAFELRLLAWLQLLHTSAMRGGGVGLLAEAIHRQLAAITTALPNIKSASTEQPEPHVHLLDTLSNPYFEFYFRLQMISCELARLTHYHRSRNTCEDQEEVINAMAQIKVRLHDLWGNRPATQYQSSYDLRSFLAPKIADPIIALSGRCMAAYYVEFIEMDRIVGDPIAKDVKSKQAMHSIRGVIEGDWNAYENGNLSPAYLRPLFLHAIECMDPNENRWAVDRLREIKDPISRSTFFASFGEALFEAQLQKERRVTSKYFCISHFGVSPPFL